jgi:hypothetical protein
MSYFSYFPTRNNHPVFLINDENTKQVPLNITFPDFFRHIGLSHFGANDANFYYDKIQILDGERPDQLSYRLYGSTIYYWTFFLLNDNLRLGEGLQWPLSQKQLEKKIAIDYEGQTIVSYGNKNITPIKNPIVYTKRESLVNKFQIGERVRGLLSKVEGTIVNIRPEMGQLITKDVSTVLDEQFFRVGETVLGLTSSDTMICDSALLNYAAVYKYFDPVTGREINNRNFIITDETQPTNGISSITFEEHLKQINEQLRVIRVLKKDSIRNFVDTFKQLIKR